MATSISYKKRLFKILDGIEDKNILEKVCFMIFESVHMVHMDAILDFNGDINVQMENHEKQISMQWKISESLYGKIQKFLNEMPFDDIPTRYMIDNIFMKDKYIIEYHNLKIISKYFANISRLKIKDCTEILTEFTNKDNFSQIL